jgi:quercetin dioxygenase-like cupin family protein
MTAMKPIFVPPRGGRQYPMGRIAAAFLADGAETGERYSISEWWLEPHTKGPGAHSHAEDDIFYVLEGTLTFLLGDRWLEAPRGSFVLAPGGLTHDWLRGRDARHRAVVPRAPTGRRHVNFLQDGCCGRRHAAAHEQLQHQPGPGRTALVSLSRGEGRGAGH